MAAADGPYDPLPIELRPPYYTNREQITHTSNGYSDIFLRWLVVRQQPAYASLRYYTQTNDIAPTIYEVLGITPPKEVSGQPQDPIDGVSMAYTFADAKTPTRKRTQYFENAGSRGIYHDGWFASALGPREPWVGGMPKGIKEWSPLTDKWELYNIDEDWSQANDLAAANPKKLEEMKMPYEEYCRATFDPGNEHEKPEPLRGIRWMSTTMYIFTPHSVSNLAELGAEVVKVEMPTFTPNKRSAFTKSWRAAKAEPSKPMFGVPMELSKRL